MVKIVAENVFMVISPTAEGVPPVEVATEHVWWGGVDVHKGEQPPVGDEEEPEPGSSDGSSQNGGGESVVEPNPGGGQGGGSSGDFSSRRGDNGDIRGHFESPLPGRDTEFAQAVNAMMEVSVGDWPSVSSSMHASYGSVDNIVVRRVGNFLVTLEADLAVAFSRDAWAGHSMGFYVVEAYREWVAGGSVGEKPTPLGEIFSPSFEQAFPQTVADVQVPHGFVALDYEQLPDGIPDGEFVVMAGANNSSFELREDILHVRDARHVGSGSFWTGERAHAVVVPSQNWSWPHIALRGSLFPVLQSHFWPSVLFGGEHAFVLTEGLESPQIEYTSPTFRLPIRTFDVTHVE